MVRRRKEETRSHFLQKTEEKKVTRARLTDKENCYLLRKKIVKKFQLHGSSLVV